MKKYVKHLFSTVITLVIGGIYYYFALPALNIHSADLLLFISILAIVYGASYGILGLKKAPVVELKYPKGLFSSIPLLAKVVGGIVLACILVGLVGGLWGAQIFNAARYRNLLKVEDGDFSTDVAAITYDQIPRLDSESAKKLGDRKMGELSDMVSQFSVMDNYTQINYQGRPVRVTPLRYADVFKWISNSKEGIPGYLMIDMVTQDVTLVRMEDGMKYSSAEYFNRKLERHLRFNYPTLIFAEENFEVDEQGVPYWICPTYKFTIGLYGGRDISGAVLVNAVTGESKYYDIKDVPSWVDRVYNANLIIEQYDYYGTYVHGYWNSVFAQKDCRVTTDGYNYMALGDDVYMYTGVTSVAADQSNIGFILTNQRTKETKFYSIPGAEEYSAMNSAQGQVQEMGYTATFPLLLNVDGEPTYFMALKDASNLVKMYAMVNVEQYQVVVAANTVAECEKKYQERVHAEGLSNQQPQQAPASATVSGKIEEIREAVIGGNTHFYIRLEGQQATFSLNMAEEERAILLKVGDEVRFTYSQKEQGEIIKVEKIEY